jgi:TonB-linked SusC/RagA family outer membrane protein
MQNLEAISNLKLRASYGMTGNQEIGLYQSLSALSQANYSQNNAPVIGFAPSRIANPDLTWESTEQIDLGFDLGLFNNRLILEFDMYHKNTRDLLLDVPVPFTSGYESSLQNLGEVRNKGLEIRLNTLNVSKNDFSWSTDINFSMNRNKVISLGADADEFYVDGVLWNYTSDFVIREGEEVGSMTGYKLDGVFQFEDFDDDGEGNLTLKPGIPIFVGSSPVPGDVKYLDTNSDSIINSFDRQILGSANPKHYGGITNNFKYKNLDLSIFLQWSYGNETYNATRTKGFETGTTINRYKEALNQWTPENPSNTYWKFGSGPGNVLTDFFIEDGSYIRVGNVTLGYSLPKKMLSRYKVNSARFYISGDNLLLFTKYKGYDPDVSVSRNPLTPGIDSFTYPRSRNVRMGLSINL